MKKVLFLSTLDLNIRSFCYEHILKLSKENKVIVVTNYSKKKKIFNNKNIVEKNINIFRKINIIFDIKVLIELLIILLRERVDLIITITPKAGLLGGVAGFILGVKRRLHIFTGQIWSTKEGILKKILILSDRLIIFLSTQIIFDSFSQLRYIKNYIQNNKKFNVINFGSINGVNTSKFKPSLKKKLLRKKFNIHKNEIVLLYTGRLNKDKGIQKLIKNFLDLSKSFKNLRLLLVGNDEERFKLQYKSFKNIVFFNHQEKLEEFYQISDIFCSFSKREGFGVSIIQASSCSLAIFCSDIYGLKDSVKDNLTGIKFKLNSSNYIISKKLSILIKNKKIRNKLGRQGRNYVKKYYEQRNVLNSYNKFFKKLLNKY